MIRAMDGTVLKQLGEMGADYVLGMCCLPSGELASGTDDGLVRVWKNGLIFQMLPHSAK